MTTTQGTFAVGGANPAAPQVEQFDVTTKEWSLVPGMDIVYTWIIYQGKYCCILGY